MKAAFVPNKPPYELENCEWTNYKGFLYGRTPNGLLANLSDHACVFEDGKLSVSPSILVQQGIRWHGRLTRNEWHELP